MSIGRRRLCGVLVLLGVSPAAACTTSTSTSPQLVGFGTSSGPARSLVSLQGQALDNARVVWDAGAPTETIIPSSLGATMFTVPLLASDGAHAVAVEDDSGRTTPITFFVDGDPLRIDYPRIDHVMALDAQFDEEGAVTTTLYVQGANFDVGSVVEVNDMEVATIAHKAILNNLYGVPQADLGYPIHHYVALAAVPAPMAAGAVLKVVVKNLDDKESDPVMYTLAASPAALDSDGDSLLDVWETAGHDADGDGTSDTDPYRRDILVELDIMKGLTHPLAQTTAAGPGALDAVRAMFAAAPFLNPYTTNGIHLALDVSGTVPEWDTVIFDIGGGGIGQADKATTVAFSALKENYFDHGADGDMYHYVIWTKRTLSGSGKSDQMPPLTGDDVVIGLDSYGTSYQTSRSQAEVLAHELGHNLAQRHGGLTDDRYNPNYLSVMSYAWALRTGLHIVDRRRLVTCLPFYYASAGEDEPNDQLPASVNMVVDYSAGMAQEIDESAVDEVKGVCNQAVDWDTDGAPVKWTNKAIDANDNGIFNETLKDFTNWRALRFDGPMQNGTIP